MSKLGWVHRVHTLNPGCAHRSGALRPISAHSVRWASCRGVRWAMSWPPSRPYRGRARPCRKLGRQCRKLYRDTPSTKVMRARRVTAQAPYRGALWPCRSPFWSRYKKLYSDPTPAARIARCVARAPDCIAGRVVTRCCLVIALYRSLATLSRDPKSSLLASIQNFLSRQSPWSGHACARCRTPCAQAGCIMACIVAVLWSYRRPCCAPARPCRGPPGCAQG